MIWANLDVRPGTPPARAVRFSTLILEYIAEGFGGLGVTSKYYTEQFMLLFAVLNGCLWEVGFGIFAQANLVAPKAR